MIIRNSITEVAYNVQTTVDEKNLLTHAIRSVLKTISLLAVVCNYGPLNKQDC